MPRTAAVLAALVLMLFQLEGSSSSFGISPPPSVPTSPVSPSKTWLSGLNLMGRAGRPTATPDDGSEGVCEEEVGAKTEAAGIGGWRRASLRGRPASWLCGLPGSSGAVPTEAFNKWVDALKLRMLERASRMVNATSARLIVRNASSLAEMGVRDDADEAMESGLGEEEEEVGAGEAESRFALKRLLGEQGWLASLLSGEGMFGQMLNATMMPQLPWSAPVYNMTAMKNITETFAQRRELIRQWLGDAFDQARAHLFGAWMDIQVDLQDWDLSLESTTGALHEEAGGVSSMGGGVGGAGSAEKRAMQSAPLSPPTSLALAGTLPELVCTWCMPDDMLLLHRPLAEMNDPSYRPASAGLLPITPQTNLLCSPRGFPASYPGLLPQTTCTS